MISGSWLEMRAEERKRSMEDGLRVTQEDGRE